VNTEDLSIDELEKIGYYTNQDLVNVVNAARFLNKPLLIEGPAGTGKTYLAKTLSKLLDLDLIRLQCHEGIDEDRAVYEWNYKSSCSQFKVKMITVIYFQKSI
tara:strand:- start:4912 stop:5220 length:309 start_codon:yes stop_codon:yes gene_type:complete